MTFDETTEKLASTKESLQIAVRALKHFAEEENNDFYGFGCSEPLPRKANEALDAIAARGDMPEGEDGTK